jgi:hypothetical protein
MTVGARGARVRPTLPSAARHARGTPALHQAADREPAAIAAVRRCVLPSAAGIREQARARFDASAVVGSPYPHSMSFAALGAAEVLDRWPGHPGALSLLAIVGTVIGEPAADAASHFTVP